MILILPALVAIVGLLMMALASNPKTVKIGEYMFWTGILATLIRATPEAFRIQG